MRNVLDAGPTVLNRMRLPAGAPNRPETLPPSFRGSRLTASALALGGLLYGLPIQAIEFGAGELQGSLDTTISHGLTFRVAERDPEQEAKANSNDGNLNYDRGLVSNTSKFTSDLDIGTGSFGAFARVTGFIDFENENGTRERTPLDPDAEDRVAKDLEVLDLYVTGAVDAGDAAVDFRLGKHVLNWGESTFIQNGINAVNPFDVSKLRLPGSELREALVPVWMASASVAPTDVLSIEGFYQIEWEQTRIDPVGSYFSVTDYVGPGAERAVIPITGTEILGDTGLTQENNPFAPFGIGPDDRFLNAIRDADREPDDSDQWGVALRYFAEALGDTEFGVHFLNHHSRLPLVSGRTGTVAGARAGLMRAGQVGAVAPGIIANVVAAALAQAGCPSPDASPQCAAVAAAAEAQARAQVQPLIDATPGAVSVASIDTYAKSAYYFIEYPEDIPLFGLSFNTEIGASGWALQGEYSYRRDAPLQRAERDLFGEALAPFTGCLPTADPAACIGANAVAGRYDAPVVGFVRRNVSQVQATATKVFGPTLGADGLVFVAEAALMHVHDMPDETVPLESSAGTVGDDYNDADATSWGYRMAARLDYNNALGAVNLFPSLQFGHDVSGNSPAPSGSFIEGRTALTLGLRAEYLSRWQADIGYTRYAGEANHLKDRDFVSASVKYSF